MDILLAIIVLLLAYFIIHMLNISLWTIVIVLGVIAVITYIRRN